MGEVGVGSSWMAYGGGVVREWRAVVDGEVGEG